MSQFSLLKPHVRTHSKIQSKLYHLLVSRGCSLSESARGITVSAYNDVLAQHILSTPVLLEQLVRETLVRDEKAEESKLKPKSKKMRESATQLYWEWGGKKEELSDFLKLTPSKKQNFLTNMFMRLYPDTPLPYEWMATYQEDILVSDGVPVAFQKTKMKKRQLQLNIKSEANNFVDVNSQVRRQPTINNVQNQIIAIDDSKSDSESQTINDHEDNVSKPFNWPSTYAIHTENNLPEFRWHQVGMLNAVGYKVGSEGLSVAERISTLKQVYVQTLPEVDSQKYMSEWGEPLTGKRLRKLSYTIASLVRNAKRRKSANMQVAIEHWEADLNWLKLEYYTSTTWSWPNTQVSDSKDMNTERDRFYSSSRDFLMDQYTNPNNETICQACNLPLPFKLKTGEYFWEEILVTSSISKDVCSSLILCPNHRAMYEHANETNSLDFFDALKGDVEAPLVVRLASQNYELSFTKLHRHLLKNLLTN